MTRSASSAPTTSERPPRTSDAVLVAYLFAMVMAGATIPTPLYGFYVRDLGLSPLLVTVVFASYAVGVLATLLLLGRLSDHVGRRAVLLVGVLVSVAAEVVFAPTESLGWLLVGRLISGFSAGLVTGSATAYIGELDSNRTRAGILATVANIGGLGLGPLIAGVIAQYAPSPTVLPYLAAIVVLVPAVLIFVRGVPETVTDRDGWRAGIGLAQIGVPADIRVAFTAAAMAGVAAFSVLGFVTALTSDLLSRGLGDMSSQTIGVVAFLLLGSAAAAQVVAGLVPGRTGALLGLPALPIGGILLTFALIEKSLALLVVTVVIAGLGVGFAFRAGLSTVTALAPDDRKAGVISTFFVASYVGITVPVIGSGILVTTTTLLTTAISLTVFLAVLAVVSGLVIIRSWPKPGSDHSPS